MQVARPSISWIGSDPPNSRCAAAPAVRLRAARPGIGRIGLLMAARLVAVLLLLLIAALQYSLWLGKGGWLRVWDIDNKITEQRLKNDGLAARNAALEAEVRDLKEGFGAIEERARNEMGMIRHDEIFFQVLQSRQGPAAAAAFERQP